MYSMKTLHKTVSGSYLFGTNVEGSDRDYKTVVLPSLDELLLAKPKLLKNKQHQTEEVDTEVLTLHTLTRDFVNGQTYALELVFAAPNQTETTWEFQAYCNSLKLYVTSEMNSLVGYLMGQFSKYADKGERYNEVVKVREALAKFQEHQKLSVDIKGFRLSQVVPTVLHSFKDSQYVKHVFFEGQDFLEVLGRKYGYTLYLDEVVERLTELEKSFGNRTKKAAAEGTADWKALMHAVRVGFEAEELLSTGKLTLPFTGEKQQYLLDVRNGKKTLDEVRDKLNAQLELVTQLKAKSTLPTSEEVRESAEMLLLSFLKTHYGLQ